MGLRPDTMFGCAMRFLLAPRPELRDLFARELEILSDADTLKIGIQIRTNDEILNGAAADEKSIDERSNFFECASDIESVRARPGQRVVWYLVSDSMAVRRRAKERYGDKVVTRLDGLTLKHVGDKGGGGLRDEAERRAAFLSSAGEMWLLSLCDFHVISRSVFLLRHGVMGFVNCMCSFDADERYICIIINSGTAAMGALALCGRCAGTASTPLTTMKTQSAGATAGRTTAWSSWRCCRPGHGIRAFDA